MACEADAVGIEVHRDPLVLKDVLHRGGDVLVLVLDQPRAALDHRHLGAEAAIHLREFEPDIAAADDRQMPRQRVELEDRRVGEVVDLVEARHVGHAGAAAEIEEDALGLEQSRR